MNQSGRILSLLAERGEMTCQELSRFLGVTKADARYHLNQLVENGSIQRMPHHRSTGPGRPEYGYRISPSQAPSNYQRLASVLLAAVRSASTADREKMVLAISQGLFPDIPGQNSMPGRISELVSALNLAGYQARWEARRSGPCVIFRNCPYASILPEFPELCVVDTTTLSRSLGALVQQTQRIDPERSGSVCEFHITKAI